MKTQWRILLVMTMLAAGGGGPIAAQANHPPIHDEKKWPVPLLLHLNNLGNDHDVFFTIESSWSGDEAKTLAAYPIPQDYKEATLEDELRRLSGVVPNLTFEADPKNPQIVHAIDRRLLGSSSYGLDQVLPDFDFRGAIDQLLQELTRRGIPLASATTPSKGDPLSHPGFYPDLATWVQMSEHGPVAVRSILSNFLPLRAYRHVLWTATTERSRGAITLINFRGSRWGEQNNLRVPVEWQLWWLAEEHNVFFTIEESCVAGESQNGFESQYISREGTGASLEDELQRLSCVVPNFTYQADPANPRIIHIKDARLAQIPNYSLDQTVQSIELTGTPLDLTNAIAWRGIGISFRTGGVFVSVVRLSDQFTVLHVKAGPSSVRSLLTNFLPLATYARVLWTTTTERRPGAVTQVDFQGRRLDKKTNPTPP